MPLNKSSSTLVKKYGTLNVARARDLVKAKLGISMTDYREEDKLPWGMIGTIAANSFNAKKTISLQDIKKAQTNFRQKGISPSLKKHYSQFKHGRRHIK